MKIVEYIKKKLRKPPEPAPFEPEPYEFLFLPDPPYVPSAAEVRPQRTNGRPPRKRLTGLLAGILALLLSSVPVFAVNQFAVYSPNRSRIASYDAIYDAVYDAVASGKETLDLYEYRITVEEFLLIYSDIFTTAPEFYFLSPKVIYHSRDGLFSDQVVDVQFIYDMNRGEREAASALYENELQYIVSLVPKNLSEAEKALFVHDYLIAAYSYDSTETIYDTYRLFRTRTGVCQATSLAYCAILRDLGMESALCVSPEMGHAWNVVRVDGKWYHVDLVYDDPQPDRCGRVLHEYFLLTDEEIAAKDHRGWETSVKCDSGSYSAHPFWEGVSSRMIASDGKWYYIDSTSRKLYRCSFGGANREEVFAFRDRWNLAEDPKRYWVGVFSGLSVWKGVLFVNTPGEIWTVDPSTGESKPVLDPEGTIYGTNIFRGKLEYLIASTPNMEGDEVLHEADLDAVGGSGTTLPFADVPPESIFYPSVKYVYEAGLFNGVSAAEFDLGSPFSRAMFVTVLGRLCGADPSLYGWTAFSDVPLNEWYAPYVTWAASDGLVNGVGDGRFDPAGNLTQEQMYKIAALCGSVLGVGAVPPANALSAYPDASSVSDWAVSGTAWCAANGLIRSGGSIDPQKIVTRGTAAVFFAAFAELAGKS